MFFNDVIPPVMKKNFQGLEKYSLSNCPMKDLKDRALELKNKLNEDGKEAYEIKNLQAKLENNLRIESLCMGEIIKINQYCNRIEKLDNFVKNMTVPLVEDLNDALFVIQKYELGKPVFKDQDQFLD